MRVAVLMGGQSAEREVSLQTGQAIVGALRELGHEAIEVDVDRNLAHNLEDAGPDAAFMALHGRGGEDGTVQGLLEIMRIPYTGCGVLASAVTMDKIVTKELLAFHGLPLIEDAVLECGYEPLELEELSSGIGYPLMVKPACEGSSIGVARVDEHGHMEAALAAVFECDSRALVERFVEGRLLTIGVLGDEPLVLPVLEIKTTGGFYDYEAKYQPGRSEYQVPADLPPAVATEAQRLSLEAFECLMCEGISRIDLMLEHSSQKLYVLEVNTIPGMTATSLVPKAAAAIGMDFNKVVAMLLAGARLKIDLPG